MRNAVAKLFTYEAVHRIDRGYFQYDNVVLVCNIGKHKAGTRFPVAHINEIRLTLFDDADHNFQLIFDRL
jgi:hypothetical protein